MVRDKSVSWWWCNEGHVWRSRKQWPQPLEQQHGNKKTGEQRLHNSKGNWFPPTFPYPNPLSINSTNGIKLFSQTQRKEGWLPKSDAFELWCWRRLTLSFCLFLEKTLESPLDCKEIKPVCPKGNQPWIMEELVPKLTLAIRREESVDWKRLWCSERPKAKGAGGDREWDGYIASPTQRTWIWANSGQYRRREDTRVLPTVRSPRVRHDFLTEEQQERYTSQTAYLLCVSPQ